MEQHALNILEKTTTSTNEPYTIELLWDDELPHQKNLAPLSFLSGEKKSKNHHVIKKIYKETMQEYISRDTHQN